MCLCYQEQSPGCCKLSGTVHQVLTIVGKAGHDWQRPVMGAVEGGVRVPYMYLREDDVAGQNIKEGSVVPLSPHETR